MRKQVNAGSLAVLLTAVWSGTPVWAQTPPLLPTEDRIGGPGVFFDPEFKGLKVTYQDGQRRVVLAQVHETGGHIVLETAQLLAVNATPMTESFQGPEWLRNADGQDDSHDRILYTKTAVGSTPNLWLWRDTTGTSTQIAPSSGTRYLLSGVRTAQNSVKVVYRRLVSTGAGTYQSEVRWLNTAAPFLEQTLPFADLGVAPVTWIPGTEDMLYTGAETEGAPAQIASYSTATGLPTWLTTDEEHKTDAFAFHAPERNNALVYAAVVEREDDSMLRIYQDSDGSGELGDAPGEILDLHPPADLPFIYSPESFQALDANGHLSTYFVIILRDYKVTAPDPNGRGEVWVWGLGDCHYRRKMDGSSVNEPRRPMDPEATAGLEQIFLYYNTQEKDLWRVKTGLRSPPPPGSPPPPSAQCTGGT